MSALSRFEQAVLAALPVVRRDWFDAHRGARERNSDTQIACEAFVLATEVEKLLVAREAAEPDSPQRQLVAARATMDRAASALERLLGVVEVRPETADAVCEARAVLKELRGET